VKFVKSVMLGVLLFHCCGDTSLTSHLVRTVAKPDTELDTFFLIHVRSTSFGDGWI
jgi:hypothetical protein